MTANILVLKVSRCRKLLLLFIILFFNAVLYAQENVGNSKKYTQVGPAPFADNAGHWYSIFDKSNVINARPGHPRYKPAQLTNIGDNILLYQKNNGGWPKNYDVFAILAPDQKDSLMAAKNILNTTFDNGSTYNQVEALANIYTVTGIEKYKAGALKGLYFILAAQYANGGWPQFYPLEDNYSRHITYNDGAFLGVIKVLKDITDNKPEYAFIDSKYREKLVKAYHKGLDCILKTQIIDDGKPTAWCQQHDEVTLAPAWARKYEPPSICDGESSALALFLMTIDHPDKQIIAAIQNAVVWFKQSEILYARVDKIPAPRMVTPFRVSTSDKVVVIDSTAKPIWTRYYELKTHRPLFCNRDSKVVYSLAEVDRERRDGYGWYTYAPQGVLDKYRQWQAIWAPKENVLK